MWFSFNKLPGKQETCHVRVHIGGGGNASIADPFDALANSALMLPREQKVLEYFLKMAKPTKNKAEFIIDHIVFGSLLPFCSAIPFEIASLGVISFAKQNARIRASLAAPNTPEAAIEFTLIKGSGGKIKKPLFFGDINAYVIDEDLKLYSIAPNLTQSEAEAIVTSMPLPLLGLCQSDSRQMFYALSRLGIDFSCLDELAVKPERAQIILRLLLSIDDLTKRMCARCHLVTEITHKDFFDEVEIKSTGSIPTIHILADKSLDEERYIEVVATPTLLKRPAEDETATRNFLCQLGAGPARLHDGFELTGEHAFKLLKSIAQKDMLPAFIRLDDNVRPRIIELGRKPTLHLRADEPTPKRVEIALGLSDEFDATDATYAQIISNT